MVTPAAAAAAVAAEVYKVDEELDERISAQQPGRTRVTTEGFHPTGYATVINSEVRVTCVTRCLVASLVTVYEAHRRSFPRIRAYYPLIDIVLLCEAEQDGEIK